MDLIIVDQEEVKREDLPVKTKEVKKVQPKYEVERKELSKNISKFDKLKGNPYEYNNIIARKKIESTPSAEAMIVDPAYNAVGKFLGLDTTKEWNQHYDKVYQITNWAKKKSGSDSITALIQFLGQKSRTIPSLGARRIDDLYIYSKLTK